VVLKFLGDFLLGDLLFDERLILLFDAFILIVLFALLLLDSLLIRQFFFQYKAVFCELSLKSSVAAQIHLQIDGFNGFSDLAFVVWRAMLDCFDHICDSIQ
jgi:hypothetical protein